jgi:lysine biosynthesis protein LysW
MTELCPVCGKKLVFETPLKINQSVICSNCGLELEVIWLYPLELAKVLSNKSNPEKQNENSKEGFPIE